MTKNDIIFAQASKYRFYDPEESQVKSTIDFLTKYLGNTNNVDPTASGGSNFSYLPVDISPDIIDFHRYRNEMNNMAVYDDAAGNAGQIIISDYDKNLSRYLKDGGRSSTLGYYPAGNGTLAVSKVTVEAFGKGNEKTLKIVNMEAPDMILPMEGYAGGSMINETGRLKILRKFQGQIPGEAQQIMDANYPDIFASLNMAARRYQEHSDVEGDRFLNKAHKEFGVTIKSPSSYTMNSMMDTMSVKSDDGTLMRAFRSSSSNSYIISKSSFEKMIDKGGKNDMYISAVGNNDGDIFDKLTILRLSGVKSDFFADANVNKFMDVNNIGDGQYQKKGFMYSDYIKWAMDELGIKNVEVGESGAYSFFSGNKSYDVNTKVNGGISLPFGFNHSRIVEARGQIEDTMKNYIAAEKRELYNADMAKAYKHMQTIENENERLEYIHNSAKSIGNRLKTEIADVFGITPQELAGDTSSYFEEARDTIRKVDNNHIAAMIMSGEQFKLGESVGRQSAAIQGTFYMHRQSIMHDFGYHNPGGQRHAQSDAVSPKAVINFGSEDVNLTKAARHWTSDIEEMKYKNITYKRAHVDALDEYSKSQLGKGLNSMFDQQAFSLYTYSNLGFQDSSMTSTVSAMENVSMHDNKNIKLSYSSLKKEAFGNLSDAELAAVMKNGLKNENAYIDGTVENMIFRSLLGTTNYRKAMDVRDTGEADWNAIGDSFKGITSLSTEADRLSYVEATERAAGKFNSYFRKYGIGSNTNGAAQILSPEFLEKGQRTTISGINHAIIDGINFGEDGLEVSVKGLTMQGEGAKLMANNVKLTVGSSSHLIGLKTGKNFLHTDLVINEKMTNKKRGFTGTFMGRSFMTMAFHGATKGPYGDDYERNFNAWKENMIVNTRRSYPGGEADIFKALNIDITFGNNGIVMRDMNLLGDDNRIRSHEDITRTLESNFKALFKKKHINGKKDSVSIGQELIGTLYEGYDKYLETLDASAAEEARIYRKGGTIQKSYIKNGKAVMADVQEIEESYRLLTDLAKMQNSVGRKNEEALRWGRLANISSSEQHLGWIADVMNEKISGSVSQEMYEKYLLAAPGGTEYARGTKNYSNFFKNDLDLGAADSYVNGTNIKMTDYVKRSMLTKLGILDFDENGELVGKGIGNLKNIDKSVIEISKKAVDVDVAKRIGKFYEASYAGTKVRSSSTSILNSVDAYYIKAGMKGTDEHKAARKTAFDFIGSLQSFARDSYFEDAIKNPYELGVKLKKDGTPTGIMNFNDGDYVRGSIESGFKKTIGLLKEAEESYALGNKAGVESLFGKNKMNTVVGKYKKNILDMIPASVITEIREGLEKNATDQELIGINKSMHGVTSTLEFFGMDPNLASVLFPQIDEFAFYNQIDRNRASVNAATKSKIRKSIGDMTENMETIKKYFGDLLEGHGGEKKYSEIVKEAKDVMGFYIDNIEGLQGEHAANIIDFKETMTKNSMPFIIEKVATDEFGYIVPNPELQSIEKIIKLNSRIKEKTEFVEDYQAAEGYGYMQYRAKKSIVQDMLAESEQLLKRHKKIASDIESGGVLGKFLSLDTKHLKNLSFEDKLASLNPEYTELMLKKGIKRLEQDYMSVNASQFGALRGNMSKKYINENILSNIVQSKSMNEVVNQMKYLSEELAKYGGKGNTESYMLNEATYDALKTVFDDGLDRVIEKSINSYRNHIDLVTGGTFNETELKHSIENLYDVIDLKKLGGVYAGKIKMTPNLISGDKMRLASALLNRNKNFSEHYFKKGGEIYQSTSAVLKSSVAIDPREGTYIYDLISQEMKEILEVQKNFKKDDVGYVAELGHKKQEFRKALNLVVGAEFGEEITDEFEKVLTAKGTRGANNFIEKTYEKLNSMSGIVLGTEKQFKRYGLADFFGNEDYTYQALSRNPHQYISSIRGTRYVKINDHNKNLSFLSKAFGEETKLTGANNNLLFLGKLTAMSAHGDFDGDVFQALFFTNKDINDPGVLKKLNLTMEQYNLLGNLADQDLKKIITGKDKKSASVRRLMDLTSEINGLGADATNGDIFESMRDGYYALKFERMRVDEELLDENAKHAKLPQIKKFLSKKVGGEYDKTELARMINRMTRDEKKMLFASRFDNGQLQDIDKIIDTKRLSRSQQEILEKVKTLAGDKSQRAQLATLLGEFFEDGSTLKFNNMRLTDSVYDAYTGIARTGFIHNQLTEFRETSTFLLENMSDVIYKDNFEMEQAQWLKTIARKGLSFNTFGTMIDSLAISAKLGGALDPYKTTARLVNTSETLNGLLANANVMDKNAIGKNIGVMWDAIQESMTMDPSAKFTTALKSKNKLLDGLFDGNLIDFVNNAYFGGSFDVQNLSGKHRMLLNTAAEQLALLIDPDAVKTASKASGKEVGMKDIIKTSGWLRGKTYKEVVTGLGNFNGLFVHAGVTEAFGEDPVNRMKKETFRGDAPFVSNMRRIVGNFMPRSIRQNTRVMHGMEERINGIAEKLERNVTKRIGNTGGSNGIVWPVKNHTTQSAAIALGAEEEELYNAIVGHASVEENVIRNNEIPDGAAAEAAAKKTAKKITTTTEGKTPEVDAENIVIPKARRPKTKGARQAMEFTEENIPDIDIPENLELKDSGGSNIHIKNLEEQINQLTEELRAVQLELNGVSGEIQDKDERLEKARAIYKDMSKRLRDAESYINELESGNANGDLAIEELTSKLKRYEESEGELKKMMNSMDSDFKERLAEAGKKYDTLLRTSSEEIEMLNSRTLSNHIKESASTAAESTKKALGKHKGKAMALGALAVLGGALKIFQSNRSVVQLDLNEEQYESSQGSVYRALGNYNINTNIRSFY